MKLTRENFYGSDVYGEWYAAADVDALLARIRAAVVAEREATAGIPHPYGDCDGCDELHDEARAALDDLLADGGA